MENRKNTSALSSFNLQSEEHLAINSFNLTINGDST
jgi:hypothetical protein